MSTLPQWGAAELDALGPLGALEALEGVLRAGLDPAADIIRSAASLAHGELLLMPSQSARWAGVKVIAVAPGNAQRGLDRVQGVYVLFDAETLTPRAIVDGAAVTALRTPAVSMLAARPRLAAAHAPVRVVVIGGGPQAVHHALAVTALAQRSSGIADLVIAARTPERARLPEPLGHAVTVTGLDTLPDLLPGVDVVLCATSARTPLFDGSLVADGALVVAVGSHQPDARELDGALLGRSQVLVEDPATALREAGDVAMAVAEGRLDAASLVPIADAVTGRVGLAQDRPVVFKTVGMSWQDLAVVAALAERISTWSR